jgi:hypothetical protein
MALQSHFALLGTRYAMSLPRSSAMTARRGQTMGTLEQIDLREASDEQLAQQYLEFVHSGKRGSSLYQSVELEMRARNLIRQSRLDTDYTTSRSSFSPRSSMFSSFR